MWFHENDDENLSIATEDMVLKKNSRIMLWDLWQGLNLFTK